MVHGLFGKLFLSDMPIRNNKAALDRASVVALNQLDDEELSIGYFEQHGATSHKSHASMA
jgi:hypothetical protein